MEQKASGFYVIDALSLKHPAGKPFHLEARLSSRSSKQKLNTILSKGAARRAAFLEDRRSKLARRTSHVRDVCTAHKNKNAPTSVPDPRRSQSLVDRLQHAAQNRNTILERRGKTCAEAVAHAKEVARLQHLKVTEATAAKRAALEERLRVTATRRQRLLAIPRSRLLEPQTWDLHAVPTEAAITIQQWWRRAKLSPCVKSYLRFNISLEKAKAMPFPRLVKLVRSEALIKVTGRVMLRWKKMMVVEKGGAAVNWKNPSRVFLSAYMIAAHPKELMPVIGAEEEVSNHRGLCWAYDFVM